VAQTDPNSTICLELFAHKIHRYLGKLETIGDFLPSDIICVIETGQAHNSFYQYTNEIVPELHLPALFTIADGGIDSNPFGFPVLITVPERIIVQPALDETDLLDYVGKLCYRQIVQNLRRFALIPLFRRVGSNVTITEALKRYASGTSPMINSTDISWNYDDPNWEPIPDLFTLSMEEANRYSFKRNETVLYPVGSISRASTPELQIAPDADELQLPSPKSDLSDLANKLHVRSLDDQMKPEENLPSSQTLYDSFPFRKDLQFIMRWNRATANIIFGKRSIPEHSHVSLPNSIFNVKLVDLGN
jgi:hypothetical protein